MKLVFIYGPPASGKLRVARELSKLTGFRLFDNHVSIRFVESLFDYGTKPFFRLVEKCRLEMLEEAAKEGVDSIFTFVYETKSDDRFIRRILGKVNRHGGIICFVRLQCGRKELGRRVTSKSRKLQGKLASKKLLNSVLRKFDLGWEVPFRKSLTINTEANSPRRAAKMITEHYGLRASK
jgi:hypothetical protein